MINIKSIYKLLAVIALLVTANSSSAQEDTAGIQEKIAAAEEELLGKEKVYETFKTIKVVNAPTTETTGKRTLDFRITHRFGNIGSESNGGGHTLWGLDQSRDIRISFDYGITDNLQVGIGRSKQMEHLDGSVKYRFLEQTVNNKVPFSVAIYSIAAFTPQRDIESIYKKLSHRFSFAHQLLIARKFGSRLSLQLIPTISHRNLVKSYRNENDEVVEDINTIFALGAALRYQVTKHFGVVVDYYYLQDEDRAGIPNQSFYDPLGVGVELETNGHLFSINLTNAPSIVSSHFLPYTTEMWEKGAYKLGFNISRVFKF